MVNNTKAADPYSATIADLEAKVAEMTATIETLKRLRSIYGTLETANATLGAMTALSDAAKTSTNSKTSLEGDELAAASVIQLETSNCPLTGREIAGALSRTGIQFSTRDPAYSVFVALKKRANSVGDVVMSGFGKWALRKWYSESEIEELKNKWGGMGGHTRADHAGRTSKAVRKRLANGESWGRQRTVTAEHMTKAYEAIQRGASKLAAATAAGIKHPTFAWYWKTFEMEKWKPGLPFPPARRAVELKKVPKKNEMWRRDDEYTVLELNENGPH
jgi:hypothetical protein